MLKFFVFLIKMTKWRAHDTGTGQRCTSEQCSGASFIKGSTTYFRRKKLRIFHYFTLDLRSSYDDICLMKLTLGLHRWAMPRKSRTLFGEQERPYSHLMTNQCIWEDQSLSVAPFCWLRWLLFWLYWSMWRQSKKITNDQELIQSDPTSCPQNQKGNN